MKEQSAIDFLHSKILFNIGLDDNDIFKLRELVKIAKKLEEKQHGKTWDSALDAGQNRAWNVMRAYSDFDDYFSETYESKGSDGHELDDDIPPTSQYFPTSSQTQHNSPKVENKTSFGEVSDEEIKKAAHEHGYEHHSFFTADTSNQKKLSWIAACKWYREQLKTK